MYPNTLKCFGDKSGNFYLAFEGDSTIYTFDSEFRPLTAFGYAGKEMSKKEAVFHSLKEFQKGYAQNRRERGIYTGLKYIEDTGFLFRTYQRGEEHDTDGLQIYKNQVLIICLFITIQSKTTNYN